jgi:hypothetical protein
VFAIGTDADNRCFDAGSGEPLWTDSLRQGHFELLDVARGVLVAAGPERVIASSPERGELWSVRRSGHSVAARVSGDQLVVSEPGRVSVLALESGEERWQGKTSGEVVLADGRLLVPGSGHTSLVYSLRESAAEKLRTSVALAPPAPVGVRVLDGTLVVMVTGPGGVAFLDLAAAVEADRAPPVSGHVERAWLAGPFLVTAPSLSVAHLWGGVVSPIPLALIPATGALVAGPAQALVRAAERSAWLEFS